MNILNDAMFGNRQNPDDLGVKADIKYIKDAVAQIMTGIKWIVGLVVGIVITAILGLVIIHPSV